MIGIFLVHAWQQHGTPEDAIIAEIGPGRGTMMSDMLRVIRRLGRAVPDHNRSSRRNQRPIRKLQARPWPNEGKVRWLRASTAFPPDSALAANELFDAIPIRQFVRTARASVSAWSASMRRAIDLLPQALPALIPHCCPLPRHVAEGTIFEISPARDAVMARSASASAPAAGTAIIIDYGHLATGYGDTLAGRPQSRI
ncbi:hypothetical protein F2981_00505 [Sinorhizobium meliloti]|nr:hypothetical protein [Sinorhizobium meliloti]